MSRLSIALLMVLAAVSVVAVEQQEESIHAALSDHLPLRKAQQGKRDEEASVPSKRDEEASVPSKRDDDDEVPSLSASEQQELLDAHNELRKVEGSKNMMKLEWNPTLAEMAEGWANECSFAHGQPASPSSPFENVGQNIFASKPFKSPINFKAITTKWFNEKKNYDFETTSCTGICGHYTQVVWHSTTDLGCAAKQCDTLKGPEWENALVVVCNYGPAGNWKGEKPFEKGNQCAACPNSCEDGLCKE